MSSAGEAGARNAISGSRTTAIGSLPHHNVDAALEFSFGFDIPFLPQIPIRNPWEFMIPQALDGMPGLQIDDEGTATLNRQIWDRLSPSFNEKLSQAFANSQRPDAFAAFEPTSATLSAWQPFLWELSERACSRAKFQIAGPLTAQWALKLTDGSSADSDPAVAAQIFRLVLARAIAMGRRVAASGAKPIVFLDEPALFGLSASNPKHLMGLSELRLMIQALKKEGFEVGLHCCSDTDWKTVLELGLDIVSLDAGLSLGSLLENRAALEAFSSKGGRLSLGVIPTRTGVSSEAHPDLSTDELITHTRAAFQRAFTSNPTVGNQILAQSYLTPACGLALHTVPAAQEVGQALREFAAKI